MIFSNKVTALYKSNLFSRCDENGCVYYFSASDFDGLNAEPFEFDSESGNRLKGYFYRYGNPIKNKIIVFDHGMGGGHRAYMKEIELLARANFLVFSYDHTGCMESQGESTNGFSQSLSDLNACLNALKKNYNGYEFSVMGHSWGGFSTLNIAKLHPEITHIVAMSGFASVTKAVNANFKGLLSLYKKDILNLERQSNPVYFGFDAAESLKDTKTKALIIHSRDDKVVSKAESFDYLQQSLGDNKNISFLLVDGKGHNPNYTAEAVKYKDEFFATLTRKLKKGELASDEQKREFVKSFDWNKMTEQDSDLWEAVIKHFNS